jgi:mitogen-activated protein kinase organizer 1
MLDRADGKLLAAFGGPHKIDEQPAQSLLSARPRHANRNTELRVRSVFAQGDAVALSGSEAGKGEGAEPGTAAFAWDIMSGDVVATVPMGDRVKAVGCVAGLYWAAGCSDGKWFSQSPDVVEVRVL